MPVYFGLGIRQIVGEPAATHGGAGFLEATAKTVGDGQTVAVKTAGGATVLEIRRPGGHVRVIVAVIDQQLVDTIVAQGNAIALVFLLVVVGVLETRRLVGSRVIYPAIPIRERAGELGTETGHAGQVQVGGRAPAVQVPGPQGLLEAQLPGGFGVDKIDRTRGAVAPVQGALWPAQDLYPLQFRQVRQHAGGAGRVDAVIVDAHRGVLGNDHRVGVAYAADKQRQVVTGGGIGRHLQAGRHHAQVLGVYQAHGLDVLGIVGGDRYRDVLQRLAALLGGDHYLLQLGGGVAGSQARGHQHGEREGFTVRQCGHGDTPFNYHRVEPPEGLSRLVPSS